MAKDRTGNAAELGHEAQYWWEILAAQPTSPLPFRRYFPLQGSLEALRREPTSPWGEDAILIEGWFAEGEELHDQYSAEPHDAGRA